MKTLIVEDDATSRTLMHGLLVKFGECHVATNGHEAVDACANALTSGQPYDLICLDILMPELDGQEALKQIRADEERMGVLSHRGAKIIMTTALDDVRTIVDAFYGICDGYLTKPIDGTRLVQTLTQLNLVPAKQVG